MIFENKILGFFFSNLPFIISLIIFLKKDLISLTFFYFYLCISAHKLQ